VTNPPSTPPLTALDDLRDALAPLRTEHLRLDGARLVLICGAIGHVGDDAGTLVLHLRKPALSELAKGAARDLLDAGCLAADVTGRLAVARMPSGIECCWFRNLLGIGG
jgi:hypothetical protein